MSNAPQSVPLSIVIPAKNESGSIGDVVRMARSQHPDAEIIVVDDGSTDDTATIAEDAGADVIRHPQSQGNGASVKTGAREARGEILVFMDGDGQHDPRDIGKLLVRLEQGFDMAVGARDASAHAGVGRLLANTIYNLLASRLSGRDIKDLTSGFRAVRATLFRKFLYLLPNGFSYPTTITMAFLRSGFPVCYEAIAVSKRNGNASHIRPVQDGVRFFAIIFKVATLYSPLKIFLPVCFLFFAAGLGNYAYTYYMYGRFTNMSLLMFSASVIVFLIGLISEQITALTYSRS